MLGTAATGYRTATEMTVRTGSAIFSGLLGAGQQQLSGTTGEGRRPLAYLWTRTVRCPNPALSEHRVPLVRQTWLARKKGRYIALRTVVDRPTLSVGYEVVEAPSPEGLGFDPAAGSSRGQTTCPVCGATVTAEYVKKEGVAGRLGLVPLAAVILKASGRGREYLPAGSYALPDDVECNRRLAKLDIEPPHELLPADDTRWFSTPQFGLLRYSDLFTPRQLLTLCTLAAGIRVVYGEMIASNVEARRVAAIATCLGITLNRLADRGSTLCRWDVGNETAMNTFARQLGFRTFAGGGRSAEVTGLPG